MRLLASIFLLCGLVLAAAGPTGVVMTKSGPVRGSVEAGGVHIFRGIPFGADTGGQNRFKPPQPVQPWTKVRDCFLQASICPQIRLTDGIFLGKEDCLYLDVYVPPNAKNTSNLPVLFWIYGGGYSFGDGYEFGFYDGKNLAKKRNAIIVTHNYRLATLGFLALDQLKAENADHTTGNYGLQDQQAALRWVRDNIAAFGGNPNQVTIFGESAGGFSVCWHLVSPTSRGLFGAAIIESGSCDAKEFFRAYTDAVSWSQTFAATVDCDPKKVTDLLGCLRKVPTGKIIGHLMAADRHQQLMSMRGIPSDAGLGFVPALYPLMPWGPAIDGSNAGLIDTPIKLIQAKQWAAVPTIMGFNADEGSIFIIAIPFIVPGVLPPLTPATLNKTLNYFFPNNTYIMNNVWTLYPAYQWKHTDGQAAAILRDYFFACGNRRALREMKRASGTNVWMYHFTYKGDWIEDPFLGDYHSAELEYVWANPWPPIIHMFSERDHKMSDTFGTFWSNLAGFRDPNGKGTPYIKWPVYDFDGTRQTLVMDVPAGLEANLFGDRCDFWDNVGPSL